jgi:hypothetical protein
MKDRHKGKRVQLINMIDEPQMEKGLLGTIQFEDDIDQIHVVWDNGTILALIADVDEYIILTEKKLEK